MRKLHSIITLSCLLIFINASFASGGDDSLKTQMIKDWQRAKTYTRAYLETMPSNKYSYRPVDSIRSFAEQMLHLAQGNVFLMSNGAGTPRIFANRNLEKTATAQSSDSVMYFVMASYDYCIDAVKNMDASKLDEMVKGGPYPATRRAWMLKAFEHQTHHRGQATIYIRLQGIRPPNEMLF